MCVNSLRMAVAPRRPSEGKAPWDCPGARGPDAGPGALGLSGERVARWRRLLSQLRVRPVPCSMTRGLARAF